MRTFAESMRALRAGGIGFDTFVHETRERWRALAQYILKRWRSPGWMTVEDVEQELHLAAWRFVWEYDDARGGSLERYVVWNAVDKAKKRVHKARGATLHRGADGNPSRHDVPISRLLKADLDEASFVDSIASTPPSQEWYVGRLEMRDRIVACCETAQERLVAEHLVEIDSVVGVALTLYADPAKRLDLRMSSEWQAVDVVEGVVQAIAGRLGAAA